MRIFFLVLTVAVLTAGCGGGAPGAPAFRLQVSRGTAAVQRGAETIPVASGATVNVQATDVITTGSDSQAILTAGDQMHVLSAQASMRVDRAQTETEGKGLAAVTVLAGLVNFFIPVKARPQQFQASTSTVAAIVKGTVFSVDAAGPETRVAVHRGQVDLHAGNAEGQLLRSVTVDQRVTVKDGQAKDDALSPAAAAQVKMDLLTLMGVLKIDLSHF